MNRGTSARVCAGLMIASALIVGACGVGTAATDPEPVGITVSDPVEVGRADTIEFQMVSAVIAEEWPVELMVPKGWHVENSTWGAVTARIRDHDEQGRLGAEPADELSIHTEMAFDTSCDGFCEANDWQARLNGPGGWLNVLRDGAELLRDEAVPGGWVLVEQDRRDVVVTVLRWDNRAPRYLVCTVEIDDDDVQLVDQFVDACAAVVPLWFDT